MIDLRQNTAFTENIGPFLNEDDGKTRENALSILQANVQLSKNGSVFAQKNDTSSGVYDSDGHYRITFNATDTATLGRLKCKITVTGALPVWEYFMVLPANVYDSRYGSDRLQVDAVEISGDSLAADNLELDYDGTGYDKANSTIGYLTNNNDKSDYSLSAAGISAIWNFTTRTLTGFGTLVADIWAYTIRSITGGTVDNVTNPVVTDTASREASKADVSNLDVAVSTRSNHSAADVWTATTRTLTSFATLISDIWSNATRTLTAGTKDTEIDNINTRTARVDALIENVGGDRFTKKSLEQAPSGTGVGDWTTAEKEQFRDALGIDGAKTIATGGQLQNQFRPSIDILENGKTYDEIFRIMKAVQSGAATNGGLRFRDNANTKDRAVYTLDGSGNRVLVSEDGS